MSPWTQSAKLITLAGRETVQGDSQEAALSATLTSAQAGPPPSAGNQVGGSGEIPPFVPHSEHN